MMKVIILVVFVCAELVQAWQQSMSFTECSDVYYVNNQHTYKMSWGGYYNSNLGCRVSFHGYDPDNGADEYKICIKATTWSLSSSDVKLSYYTGSTLLTTYLEKTYSKYSGIPTYKWCSDSDDYVDVKLVTSSSSSFQGLITLEVTAVKTYSSYNYGGTIGGAVSGTIVLIIVLVIISIACRRRYYTRTIGYNSPVPATTVITQSGSQQMGGYTNPGYPTGPVAPPPYQPPTNQYPGVAPNTQYPAGPPNTQYPAGPPNTQYPAGPPNNQYPAGPQNTQYPAGPPNYQTPYPPNQQKY